MTNHVDVGVSALISVISLAGLFILYRLSKALRIDVFRQDMFILRDEMFLYAANGYIPFDHPAYVVLRTAMNGFIRFGHKITWPYFLIKYMIGEAPIKEDGSFVSNWNNGKMLLKDNPDVLQKMESFYMRMSKLAIIHLMLMNFELIFPVFFLLIAKFWYDRAMLFWNKCMEKFKFNDELEELAYAYGKV